MNRDDFIKVIPKPTNEDVILYDISLKDLIDVDVPYEYCKLLPVFKKEKKDFLKMQKDINNYKEIINQTFLYNPSWSKEKYLEELQENMKTYSTLYGNIKRKEDEIKILQKKIEAINEKIIIQKNIEEKEDEERQQNIDNEIEDNKINFKKTNDILDTYKSSLKRIEEQIRNVREDLKILNLSERQLNLGIYKCFCCGKEIENDESEYITNHVKNNIIKYKENLKMLLEEKEKIKNTIKYYKDESSKIKAELKNNLSFKRNYKRMYIKKSTEILKLEACRNTYFDEIEKVKQSLKDEPYINSKKFLELKNRIEKYNLSLENLRKIKNMKALIGQQMGIYNKKQDEIKKMENLIKKYLSFLNIYYKIYEQKASQFAGPDYKIKLFNIENYEIVKILNIKYKDVDYPMLKKRDKQEVDKNLIKKFSTDF